MFKQRVIKSFLLLFLATFSHQSIAAFPDDFSDVIWIDPDVSSFPVTASVTADVSGSSLVIRDTKASVWPAAFHSDLRSSCCNRSLWIVVKLEGQWYASTFEYMRFGQVNKFASAVNGQQIKRSPFLTSDGIWQPANGEVYGFFTSGMARFNLNNLNVRERSNVALYRWGVGPTDNIDFEEVPRDIEPEPEPDPDPEVCVEPEAPEPVNNTHTYSGEASGVLDVTGTVDTSAEFNESITVTVLDDRSLNFIVDGQSFNTSVAQDNTFSGQFILDILGQCSVTIDVSGSIEGQNTSGIATGRDSCLGNQATLNATFTAQSPTTPNYLDQRSPIVRRSVCGGSSVIMAPIIDFILQD